MKRVIAGINIQFPISGLILDGTKTIETRTYPIPEKYIGVVMALIETPGKLGDFKARITGIVRFKNSFEYKTSSQFYADVNRHCVTRNSEWAWNSKKKKWGWPVEVVAIFKTPIQFSGKKGIRFTERVSIPRF